MVQEPEIEPDMDGFNKLILEEEILQQQLYQQQLAGMIFSIIRTNENECTKKQKRK